MLQLLFSFMVILSRQRQLNELVDGGAHAVGVLTSGGSEVRLATAAALHELGSFADTLADVHAVLFHEQVAGGTSQ